MSDKNETGVSRKPKRLNRQPISGTTVHGKGAMLFGLPFLAVGVFIILISADIIPQDDSKFGAPRWVVGIVGGVFGAVGAWLIIHGFFGLLRNRRKKRILQDNPGQPWFADYEWNPEGMKTRGAIRASMRHFIPAFFISLFLTPFHYIGWSEGIILFGIVAALFSIWPICLVGYGFYCLGRALKYGKSFLRFSSFPFYTGETLSCELIAPRGIGKFTSFKMSLRAIREKVVTRKTSDGESQQIVCEQVYCDTQCFEGGGEYIGGDAPLPITFEVPDDVFETNLADRPAQYWEVEVSADTPGIDYDAAFMVPIYIRQ